MDLGIRGRTAVVCASSQGLGKACARALAEAGVSLVINGRNRELLDQTAEEIRHATGVDVKAVIAWLRDSGKVPVWLVGTSRGTQSVGYVATELAGQDGPDGIVLTSSILRDKGDRAVPAMPLERIRVPVLVVHHEQDGCKACPFADVPALMSKLGAAPRSQLLAFRGGENQGDPCEAFAHHGYNGLERDVVQQISAWILAK